jgi:hypothetical protein
MATARWVGLDRLLPGFRVVGRDVQRAVDMAQRKAAERIMNKAQRLVPRVTGYLANSRYIRPAQIGGMRALEVGFAANYALAVHEIPRPRSSNGVWKYLETPYLEELTGYERRIAKDVRRALRGRR